MKAILVVDVPNDWHCTDWCVEGALMGKNEDGYWMFVNEIVEAPLRPVPSQYCVSNREDQFDNERYFIGYNKAIRDCVGDENIEY